jgi:Cu-Zn family superoxide dismutase
MRFSLFTSLALGAAATAGACIFHVDAPDDDGHEETHARAAAADASGLATAVVEARSGSSLRGLARFVAVNGGVEVTVTLEGAPPGWHAVHIHEKGDCSADDASSAGGHFNPGGVDHGSPHAAVHHAGDLGSMWVKDDGTGYHKVFMPELTINTGERAVVGRSIIVHEKIDDLVTQPTGAAGGRIGCGEIR